MKYLIATFLCLGLILNGGAKAEELTLEQALRSVVENTPSASRIARDLEREYARARNWEVLENPELEVNSTVAERDGDRGMEAELTVPLRPSNFGDRQALARAIRDTASLEERAQLLSLLHDTTRRYLDLWQLQRRTDLLRQNIRFAQETSTTIERAARIGEARVSEAHLFRAEVLRYKEELSELEASMRSEQLAFLHFIGRGVQALSLRDPGVPALPSLRELMETAQQGLHRQILEAQRREAQKRLGVAEADAYLPEISPRLSYNRGYGNDREEIGVGVRLRIPFWDRNEADINRARADMHFLETSIAAYDRVGYEKFLARKHEEVTASFDRFSRYRDLILPEYEKSFDSTQKMLSGGQASVLQLWQVHERLLDVRRKSLSVQAEAFSALLELENLVGHPIAGEVQ